MPGKRTLTVAAICFAVFIEGWLLYRGGLSTEFTLLSDRDVKLLHSYAVFFIVVGQFACLGGVLFYDALRKLRLDRKIKGLATSKVRSVATGTVELCGHAVPARPLRDPVFDDPCAYYRVRISQYKGKHWRHVHVDESKDTTFYLEDETGRAIIEPDGAELHLGGHFTDKKGLGGFGEAPAQEYIKKIIGTEWSLLKTLRVDADIIKEGHSLYVLGYARPLRRERGRKYRMSLPQIARRLKADVKRMTGLDVNKDGTVDGEEWDKGLRDYGHELEQKGTVENVPNVRVSKGPDKLLVFADSEMTVLRELEASVLIEIVGGSLLMLISLISFWILFASPRWF